MPKIIFIFSLLILSRYIGFSQTISQGGINNKQINNFNKLDTLKLIHSIERVLKKNGLSNSSYELKIIQNQNSISINNYNTTNNVVNGINNGINGNVTIVQDKKVSKDNLLKIAKALDLKKVEYKTKTNRIFITAEFITNSDVVTEICQYLRSIGYDIIGQGVTDEYSNTIGIGYNEREDGFLIKIGSGTKFD